MEVVKMNDCQEFNQHIMHDNDMSDDSEAEHEGEVNISDDQRRAMIELVAQKREHGHFSDDPPEYNVKERLMELNADLTMEPVLDSREYRVGFKQDLVQFMAPTVDISDDESLRDVVKQYQSDIDTETSDNTVTKKEYVVEREGKFDVLADYELTAEERANLDLSTADDDVIKDHQTRKSMKHSNMSAKSSNSNNHYPPQPSKSRPRTADRHSRRNTMKSNNSHSITSSECNGFKVDKVNYISQYALSAVGKEQLKKRVRFQEQKRKDEKERQNEEQMYRRKEAEDCFQGWLRRKQKEDKQKRSNQKKDTKSNNRKVNSENFSAWLKQKEIQIRNEKLMKQRQEQEIRDGFYVRSREECNNAFSEWLRKKCSEMSKKKCVEKQRSRSLRAHVRQYRKYQQISQAIQQSQAFRYVDYYGYRV